MVATCSFGILILFIFQKQLMTTAATLNNLRLNNIIINGNQAAKNQFPWQVMVRSSFPEDDKFCGGVILSMNWILTGGQCIDKANNVTLSVGSNLWSEPKVRIDASRWVVHPEYRYRSARHNDLGLIQLEIPLKFSESIQPVHLPAQDQIGVTFVGVKSRFPGWGSKDTNSTSHQPGEFLKWMDLIVIKNSDCASDYGSIVTDAVVCARGGTICGSDFGGPLTVQEKEGWVVIGVASFTQGCDSAKPIGFSRVTSYLQWISEVTGIKISL